VVRTTQDIDIAEVPLSGTTLIEASAGTGKTYALAALYVRFLLESELSVDQILVVTYTRAATAELRVRIRRRITETLEALERGEEGLMPDDVILAGIVNKARDSAQSAQQRRVLKSALDGFDEAAIFTIHGFCQRVLKRHAFESGVSFDVELTEDQPLLLEEIACDYWSKQLALASEPLVEALIARNVEVETLVRFLRRVLANPELELAPGPRSTHVGPLERNFVAARARVAELWAEHKLSVLHFLLASGLNKNSYAPSSIRGTWSDTLDAIERCSAQDFGRKALEWFSNLTPSKLRAKTTKSGSVPEHAFFDACEELLRAAEALRRALDQNIVNYLHDFRDYALQELRERSEQRAVLGFEDLLSLLLQALKNERGAGLADIIRRNYRAALIDEFQDTDPIQFEVFQRIYAASNLARREARPALFFIGDPKQAIYAFRGADIFTYLAATRTVDRQHTQGVNYRSDPSVLRAIEALYMRAALPFAFSEIAFWPVQPRPGARDQFEGAALEFLFISRDAAQQAKPVSSAVLEKELPARIATEIAALLNSGTRLGDKPVGPHDIAVLCRTNAQAQAVQVALRERGVPAVLDCQESVFNSEMAEELDRLMWAMVEPGTPKRVRAALATIALGVTAEELVQLDQDEQTWDGWVERFHDLQELWQTQGFVRALRKLCDDCQVTKHLLGVVDGERRYTDLWHLSELLHEAEQRTRKGPRALLDFYRGMRAGLKTSESLPREAVQLRLESDSQAVTLTTIHKSKGLEYALVYLPFLWGSAGLWRDDELMPLFHDPEGRSPVLTLPGAAQAANKLAKDHAEREALAEGLRLLYVALTRAKHKLSVVWGRLGKVQDSALGYLLHQPPGTLAASGADVDVDTLRAATAKRISSLADAEMRADLEALAQAADSAVCVRELGAVDPRVQYKPPESASAALQKPHVDWPQRLLWRVGSFSSLVEGPYIRARASATPTLNDALDRDRDARAPRTAVLEERSHTTAERVRVPLADFPAGAAFGHWVHSIYERAEFQGEKAALEPIIAGVLTEYGAERKWLPGLRDAIYDSWHTPLAAAVDLSLPAANAHLPNLACLARDKYRTELEFTVPVVDPELASDDRAALRARQLAELIERHTSSDSERAYAQHVARLRFAPLRGFLRGFIDLVAEHEGRYFILDYKSNRLGDTPSDYQPAALEHTMLQHHYVLQYLLYTVAVHRYLTVRIHGYDYDQHFGGVYYLFIRGMSPSFAPGNGVYFARPARALIEALSDFLRTPRMPQDQP